jgi:predicted CoA-binding protein
MTTKAAVEDFLSQRALAVVGVSRQDRKFGNAVYRELTSKGYTVFAVNPHLAAIDGASCYPSLTALPEPVGGAVLVTPPAETERVVRDAAAASIRRVWMQQGSASPAAIRFCEEQGITVIHRKCILMFAQPVTSIHRVHRWLWRVFGMLPK